MRGTLVAAVSDGDEDREALELAVELSRRLDLRLVLVHVSEGIGPVAAEAEEAESVTMLATRNGAARVLARLAAEHGIADRADLRSGAGDAATFIGQIAAEEAADLIVVGARQRGRLRRGVECRLAEELASETPVPILIAPPRRRARRLAA